MSAAERRRIVHPGPVAAERITAVPCRAQPVTLRLREGASVEQAIAEASGAAGLSAAYLRLRDLPLAPLAYVIPAPAPGDGHAAWYSRTYSAARAARVAQGGAHLGQREGRLFVHCHGLWDGVGAGPAMGHLLPSESVVAADCTVPGWGIGGAVLRVGHDAETRFSLFRPARTSVEKPAGARALLCTIRPNRDITEALTGIGIRNGRIEGIGSFVGTTFVDGPGLDSYATEMLVLDGRITDGVPRLRVASVGFDGRTAAGWLAPGANPVCVTAELLIIDEGASVRVEQ